MRDDRDQASADPGRNPVKVTVALSPELSRSLADYAAFYETVYGQQVTIAELVPPILQHFLETDRSFVRRQRNRRGQS